jgi:hypothetical protein
LTVKTWFTTDNISSATNTWFTAEYTIQQRTLDSLQTTQFDSEHLTWFIADNIDSAANTWFAADNTIQQKIPDSLQTTQIRQRTPDSLWNT